MKRSVALLMALTLAVHADPQQLRDLLRDGLYAEEINRDKDAAAKQYEQIVARFDEERPFAANALYRLAEIRRAQNRKEDAIALYQRVLTQFPDADPQANLARNQLATLGAKLPEPAVSGAQPPLDPEAQELAVIKRFAASSPDKLKTLEVYQQSLKEGWITPVIYALDHGGGTDKQLMADLLEQSCSQGHLGLTQALLSRKPDLNSPKHVYLLLDACSSGYVEITKALLEAGIHPDGKVGEALPTTLTPLIAAVKHPDIVRLLISKGADVNLAPPVPSNVQDGNPDSPLHAAVEMDMPETSALLLKNKANVDLIGRHGRTPLWIAASSPDRTAMVKLLLDAGANPEAVDKPTDSQAASSVLEGSILNGPTESAKLILEAIKKKHPTWTPSIPEDFLLSRRASSKPPSLANLRILLEAGAVPNSEHIAQAIRMRDLPSIDQTVARKWAFIELLLSHGATIDPEWKAKNFTNIVGPLAPDELRLRLLRRCSYPDWSNQRVIMWISSNSDPLQLASAKDDSQPDMNLKNLFNFANRKSYRAQLYRKNQAGELKAEPAVIHADGTEPKLQWGDILEEVKEH